MNYSNCHERAKLGWLTHFGMADRFGMTLGMTDPIRKRDFPLKVLNWG
jgi:hypothetical protein